jgi:hypothetical protein
MTPTVPPRPSRTMNPLEFAELLNDIGWSELQAAKRTGMTQTTLRRLSQRSELPRSVVNYLRTVASVIRAVPAPEL